MAETEPRFTLAQRKVLIATLPWVAVFPVGLERTCRKMVSSAPTWARHLSFRAERGRSWLTAEQRAAIQSYICHRKAPYVYLTVDGADIELCYMHAAQRLYGYSMAEEKRYLDWVAAHPLRLAETEQSS